jgi:predicted DNA-binding transcriptional regulator AlpA
MKSPKIKRRPPLPRPKMQRVSNDSDDESPAQHSTTTPIRFMSKAEVAAAIGVSPVMIWKWCVAGAFPFGKEVGAKPAGAAMKSHGGKTSGPMHASRAGCDSWPRL